MYPDGKVLSGKRLVPQLMVGCVVFALIGLLGTFALGKFGAQFLHGTRAEFAKEAEAREAGKR